MLWLCRGGTLLARPSQPTLSTASVKKHDGYRLMAGGDAACPPAHPQPNTPAVKREREAEEDLGKERWR